MARGCGGEGVDPGGASKRWRFAMALRMCGALQSALQPTGAGVFPSIGEQAFYPCVIDFDEIGIWTWVFAPPPRQAFFLGTQVDLFGEKIDGVADVGVHDIAPHIRRVL
jgi:hypothetical protein